MRTENWKYVERRDPIGPSEFYDMKNDPYERVNLFGQSQYAEVQKQLQEKLYQFFDKYADPQYDIWKGGRSKARRLYTSKGHPDYRPLRSE